MTSPAFEAALNAVGPQEAANDEAREVTMTRANFNWLIGSVEFFAHEVAKTLIDGKRGPDLAAAADNLMTCLERTKAVLN